jgi:hypothetical protein
LLRLKFVFQGKHVTDTRKIHHYPGAWAYDIVSQKGFG